MLRGRLTLCAWIALGLVASCTRHPGPGVDGGVDAAIAPDAAPDSASESSALYRSESNGFRVEFPEGKAPEIEDKTLPKGAANARLFKVQYGSSAFVVLAEEWPEGGSRTVQQILDGAREGVLESTGGTAQSDVSVAAGDYRGFEMVLSATTSGIKMRQRIRVLTFGRRLYQLLVIAPEWSGSTALEQRFFDSFEPLLEGRP